MLLHLCEIKYIITMTTAAIKLALQNTVVNGVLFTTLIKLLIKKELIAAVLKYKFIAFTLNITFGSVC